MKLKLQISVDRGETWVDDGAIFRGRDHARSYLDQKFGASNVLDWRVGFLLMTKPGEGQVAKMYRVTDKIGVPIS